MSLITRMFCFHICRKLAAISFKKEHAYHDNHDFLSFFSPRNKSLSQIVLVYMQSIAWRYFDDTKMIKFLKGMAKLIHPINKISKFKINPNQSFDLIVQESPDDPMRTLNSAYGGSRISRRSESFSAPWHLSELANDFYDKFNTQMTGGLLTIVTALKIFRTSRTIQGTFVDQRLSYQTLSHFFKFSRSSYDPYFRSNSSM